MDKMPRTAINSASTTKVYGLRKASRTIHIKQPKRYFVSAISRNAVSRTQKT
jgi:hypothetical protein